MPRLLIFIFSFLIASCGNQEPRPANPTNCAVNQLDEGVEWICIDHNGIRSRGIVRHGTQGPAGEQGPAGSGLTVAKVTQCAGEIEGWLEDTAYEIAFRASEFETGDRFISATTKLVREGEVINLRSASSFMVGEMPDMVSDGQFVMRLEGNELLVTSQGGIDATLRCEVL